MVPFGVGFLMLIVLLSASFSLFVWVSKKQGYQQQSLYSEIDRVPLENQFPVSVNAYTKEIYLNPTTEGFLSNHVASANSAYIPYGWFDKLTGKLALSSIYQNFASLSTRMVVIQSGERKEEVARNFGKILGWSPEEKVTFLSQVASSSPELGEGKFYPGRYTVSKDISPEEMAALVYERFSQEILGRYGDEVAANVALEDALIIASLLEREAYDFNDMRHIAGVIWNRLFAGMRLQLDASLQYARGSSSQKTWWPKVVPDDKYITSPFNTYAHEGLPPSPIANPSAVSVLAALNPIKTDCMFYFHDKRGKFYCTETYDEHVALLKKVYGRGK